MVLVSRDVLVDWAVDALRGLGGQASVLQVSKWIWQNHEGDLRKAGDLLYTWQYDLRWAGKRLRDLGRLKPVYGERTRPWELQD